MLNEASIQLPQLYRFSVLRKCFEDYGASSSLLHLCSDHAAVKDQGQGRWKLSVEASETGDLLIRLVAMLYYTYSCPGSHSYNVVYNPRTLNVFAQPGICYLHFPSSTNAASYSLVAPKTSLLGSGTFVRICTPRKISCTSSSVGRELLSQDVGSGGLLLRASTLKTRYALTLVSRQVRPSAGRPVL